MRVRVLNASIDEALHTFASAGFAPQKLENNMEISLLPRKAQREELLKAVAASETFVKSHHDARLTVFSGGKGRPFHVPKMTQA